MKVLGIIPARYASSRFLGKPLAMIGGKTMIERVFRGCSENTNLFDLVVATDDSRIFDAVA
ncbi:MAG: 3-deoxy-manno-octulosonate cytidylyltransferase, partial [Saprospiraceae bacterium]|nr:3-deoxy-manno-octulosonate cytidylyltransferase [Saprospiraceae bacterium]